MSVEIIKIRNIKIILKKLSTSTSLFTKLLRDNLDNFLMMSKGNNCNRAK